MQPRPVRLTAAAAIAAAEGAVLVVWAVSLLVVGAADGALGDRAVLAATVLTLAVIPLAAAYGLLRMRRWSRGPAMITQLIALPVAWTMVRSGGAFVAAGAVLGVAAAGGLVLLIHPATTRALGIGAPRA